VERAREPFTDEDFGKAQVGSGADGKELGEAFNNSQEQRKKIVVQFGSDDSNQGCSPGAMMSLVARPGSMSHRIAAGTRLATGKARNPVLPGAGKATPQRVNASTATGVESICRDFSRTGPAPGFRGLHECPF